MTAGSPTPDQVKAARAALGLTQTGAAAVIHSTLRSWQCWEYGKRNMPPAKMDLFLLKTARRKRVVSA